MHAVNLLAEAESSLPVSPYLFGAVALVAFIALAFVTWSFRDVANRHPRQSAAEQPHATGAHEVTEGHHTH